MPARLAIITVNWNQTASTCRCLGSLAGFERLQPEIWVVDNASRNGGAEVIASEFPQVHLIANPSNLGFGAANNQALRELDAPFVLLLNNDAFIPEADLAQLVEALEQNPHLAVVGPAVTAGPGAGDVIALGGRDVGRHIRTHLRPADLTPERISQARPFQVRYVPGAIALLRTQILEEIGFLEESYFFGGELADFCEVAAGRGYSAAVLPAARGWHDMGESDELRQRLYPYYILRNRFLFVRRHRRRLLAPLMLLWTGYGLAVAGRALGAKDTTRARLLLLAVADGLRGRFGNQNRRVLGQ